MSSTRISRNLADNITTSTNTYLRNRVNVNTASADVLTALFMGAMGQNADESTAESAAQTLVTYRQQNPENLSSVAWVMDALGNTSPVVTALAGGDYHHHPQLPVHGGHRGRGRLSAAATGA